VQSIDLGGCLACIIDIPGVSISMLAFTSYRGGDRLERIDSLALTGPPCNLVNSLCDASSYVIRAPMSC